MFYQQIGDGSEEGKSIKIITSVDQTPPKGRQGTSKSMHFILFFAFLFYVCKYISLQHACVHSFTILYCVMYFSQYTA